jgi:hypothetical protein
VYADDTVSVIELAQFERMVHVTQGHAWHFVHLRNLHRLYQAVALYLEHALVLEFKAAHRRNDVVLLAAWSKAFGNGLDLRGNVIGYTEPGFLLGLVVSVAGHNVAVVMGQM